MPVCRYLDLSTSHLTEAEMDAVSDRLADVDEATPRVIAHEYGAWVNVPDDCVAVAEYPNLVLCLNYARALGCTWVNFDQDGDTDAGLPTFNW